MRYYIFIFCWIALGIITGLYLLRKEAPYGRYSNTHWGPMISNRWGWFFMEATVMGVFILWIPFKQFNWHTPATVMIALFFIHYIHRSLIYPFMIRTRGKKMPLIIMLSAIVFNTVNGSLLGIWFGRYAHYTNDWYLTPMFICGSIVFIGGMLINRDADYHLISLRKKGDTGYTIPQAGLFKLIASPNLFGEILEWTGFFILTWSLPALAFLIWTCANLVPRAVANRRWYRKQFADYPTNRKILFPYIW